MVSKSVEARARTTEVIGSRGHPSVFSSNVDQLILVKRGEWNISQSTLSLLMFSLCFRRTSVLDILLRELSAFEGSLCVRTKGQACGRQGKTQDGGREPHDA